MRCWSGVAGTNPRICWHAAGARCSARAMRNCVGRASLDVKPDRGFSGCHFKSERVMPGCLGLDAMWQMVGFYLGWIGGEGRGRALGGSELAVGVVKLSNGREVGYK